MNFAGMRGAVQVKNADRLISTLQQYPNRIKSKVHIAMKRSAIIVMAEASKLIRSGYYKPAIDTGRMRGSLTHTVRQIDYNRSEAEVGTNVYYAIYVHEGHQSVPARPFLVDALKNKRKDVMNEFRRAFDYEALK